MAAPRITGGVESFSGIFESWYGYARSSDGRYLEGKLRMFKWRARLDVLTLKARLRKAS